MKERDAQPAKTLHLLKEKDAKPTKAFTYDETKDV